MKFKPVPRTLKWEFGYWGGTLKNWYKEGLPKNIGFETDINDGDQIIGPGVRWGSPSYSNDLPLRAFDVNEYFKLDGQMMLAPYDYWIFPKFLKDVVHEDENYIIFRNEMGIKVKELKDGSSMPLWLDFQ